MSAQAGGALVLPSETNPEIPVGSGIGSTAVIANDWAPSNGARIQTDLAIVLENVAHGYKKPNILDVKLGARLWADDAPAVKRMKLDKVAAQTTSGPLGFRIAGMKTYQGASESDYDGTVPSGYKLFDKEYGRSFTVRNVDEAFGDYFLLPKEKRANGPIRKVIRRFIDDLQAIQEVIEHEESRMYSASLLFVYEGDRQALQDAFAAEPGILKQLRHETSECGCVTNRNGTTLNGDKNGTFSEDTELRLPSIQSLKLIDFAHAEWSPGQGPDQNVLHGIRNVVKVLHELI